MTEKSISELALEILKHNHLDLNDVLRQNNHLFELEMNSIVYYFKFNTAGKYHYLSMKKNDEYLLVYSICDD